MPYIVQRRTDIPSGTIQILDLWPNVSQKNNAIDPVAQTKYVRYLQNETVTVSANVTLAAYKGLAAYLIDAVAAGVDGHALTATEANTMAASIVTNIVTAGAAATVAGVNVRLAAVNAGTALTAGGSVGTIADVLKILAGGEYVLPAGSAANSGGAFKGALVGAFTAGQYRPTYTSGPLLSSIAEGKLHGYAAATFSYGGTAGGALVVYDDTGAVIS